MRILVAIANHGTKNEKYVRHLIKTYQAFSMDVHIVILSDVPKYMGPDIEVRTGAPTSNPWSLPFAHRKLFVERQNEYDLFIYSEDDTEITEKHIFTFLKSTSVLPEDYIVGFIRYENAPNGTRYYSTIHGPYYWDPNSILQAGGEVYAQYTNCHSACYVLTRNQLKKCIVSGGFDVPPHEGRYDMLCSAATDPYINCGFKKVIGISNIDAFCLHHLPDIYLGRIGIETEEINAQVGRMLEIAKNDIPRGPLFQPVTKTNTTTYDKKFFEPERREVCELAPVAPSRILSVGCERGLTEGALVAAGHTVSAIPLDPVIAVSAKRRGVNILVADIDLALKQLQGERFECLLFNNILSHIYDPPALIERFLPLLESDHTIIISFDNASSLSALKRQLREHRLPLTLNANSDFTRRGYHPTSARTVQGWMRKAKVYPEQKIYCIPKKYSKWCTSAFGVFDCWFAHTGAVAGRKS